MNSWSLDAASARPSVALRNREDSAIIEVPAVTGSNQLPLEEVTLWPPDADVPSHSLGWSPHPHPQPDGEAPPPLLFPLLILDLFPLPSISTNKKTRVVMFLKHHCVPCTLATIVS